MSRLSARWGRGAIIAAVLALLALVSTPAHALHAEPIGPTEPIRGKPLDIPAMAERGLTVRLDRIPDRAALVIPLPDGGRIVAVRNRLVDRLGGDFLWQGKPQGQDGDVVLTVTRGSIAGAITTADGAYLIREAPNGQVRILLVDEGALPIEMDAWVPAGDTDGGGDESTPPPPTSADGNVILDVMIVYTPQARAAAGGVAQIEAAIQNAVDWANVAYQNSLVSVEQRLVRTQEVAHDEATTCQTSSGRDMGCDLIWLRNDTGMHDLRNTYGADLMALITQSGQYCGIGYVMTSVSASFAPYAVSVTLRICLPSTHAHETGHNLGCMHDPDNSGFAGAYPYAFGHRYCMSGGFRTIMSYVCSGASRIPYFANPDVSFDNGAGLLPTGTWTTNCTPTCNGSTCTAPCRDCAQTIDLTAPTAAAWRASATASCGDGVVNQTSEQCDGNDFAGATCATLGFSGGELACTASCSISTAGCAICGNGVVDAGEACDGTSLGGATCASQGCTGGTPTCAADCTSVRYDTCTGCATCGDGVKNQASEECDGADLGGASCAAHGCLYGSVSCTSTCQVDYAACSVCCGDGVCEAGEDCATCDIDCPSGPGSSCGNGICEAGDGEDCVSCPADCRGVQSGKPGNRYCCGDGDGQNPKPCSDPVCTSNGWQCTSFVSGGYCCGDGVCSGPETSATCAQDCGAPPVCGDGVCNGSETGCSCPGDCGAPPEVESDCGNGLDDDCDGLVDCADPDCASAAVCETATCQPRNASCTSDGECCSGACVLRGKKRSCS